jgi:hypothetical protein
LTASASGVLEPVAGTDVDRFFQQDLSGILQHWPPSGAQSLTCPPKKEVENLPRARS